MVAEASKPALSIRRKQERIPILTRIKVRNLYLNQDLPYRDIAHQCGLTEQQVGKVVIAEGLSGLRRKRKQDLISKSDARAHEQITEVAEAIASEGDEITLGALAKAKECVANGGKDAPKDFQAWTGGIRNLVTVARACRGLDSAQQQAAQGGNVSVFVLRCGDLEAKQPKAQRNITPDTTQHALPIAYKSQSVPAGKSENGMVELPLG